MVSMKKVFGVIAGAAVLAIGFAPANAAPSAPAAPAASPAAIAEAQAKANDPNSGLLDRLNNEEKDLLNSSKVKSVLLDAKTGAVLSVGEGDFVPEGAAPGAFDAKARSVVPGECWGPPPQPCYYGSPNLQFAGTGTDYGNWGYRTGYTGGPFTANACWVNPGVLCGVAKAPYTTAYFNAPVTGVSHSRW